MRIMQQLDPITLCLVICIPTNNYYCNLNCKLLWSLMIKLNLNVQTLQKEEDIKMMFWFCQTNIESLVVSVLSSI